MTDAAPDIFRKQYRQLDDLQKNKIVEIKDLAELLYNCIDIKWPSGVDMRMVALAKTNLEQAVMWAIKSIT